MMKKETLEGWKKLGFGFAVLFLMIGFLNFSIYLSPNYLLYHPKETIFYNHEDQEIYRKLYHYEGKYVELERMSPYLPSALVASEDKRFYQHHGLDYARIAKSAWNNLWKGRISQGGSTITQQFARTLYLTNEKSWSRKLNEAWIAKKLEMTYSKEQILEGYLNCAYFGHNLYGVDQASDYFFHKNPIDLTLAESSMLIGIMSAPSYYSPEVNEAVAKEKQQQVLSNMKKQRMITESEYFGATSEKLTYYYSPTYSLSSSKHYYADAIAKQLERSGISTHAIENLGLEIHSCLDLELQNKIEHLIRQKNLSSEIAVVVMKPYSGDVLALIGGKDYTLSSFNRAISAKRQTGSAIKPLLYYLGLQSGMTPLTKMRSEPTTFYIDHIGEYSPKNANDQYANRDITMLEALALSDNIYAVKTTLLLGSATLQSVLNKFGVDEVDANPTIGLGTTSMTPLELTSIFNTFASEGAYYAPRFVRKVCTQTGTEIYRKSSYPSFYLGRDSVIQLNYMLRSPFDRAFQTYATPSMLGYEPEKRFATKTGTTDQDRWVMGFNPYYTIGIWIGNDDNSPIQDGAAAKQLFQSIANIAMERYPDRFYNPEGLLAFQLKNTNGRFSDVYYKEK